MDSEVLARTILDLREHYEDDGEFEAALERLKDELGARLSTIADTFGNCDPYWARGKVEIS